MSQTKQDIADARSGLETLLSIAADPSDKHYQFAKDVTETLTSFGAQLRHIEANLPSLVKLVMVDPAGRS